MAAFGMPMWRRPAFGTAEGQSSALATKLNPTPIFPANRLPLPAIESPPSVPTWEVKPN